MSVVTDQALLQYAVPTVRDGWELTEAVMPESVFHDEAAALIKAILEHWVEHRRVPAQVVRNLAVRWVKHRPQVGVDPDVAVLSPPPPVESDGDLTSVRTWVDGNVAPILAIEVVSDGNLHKDYVVAPEKYAASGIGELWVFDPKLCGPASHGGPYRLQVWRRDPDGTFTRVYAGDGPAYSLAIEGHLVVMDGGRTLRISDDDAGHALWLTAEEAARASETAAHARIAELERELAHKQRGD
jgi:Uma2 family endonuclease